MPTTPVAQPPRFGYVVLAHTGTDAVVRLVRRIRALSPTAEVVVRFGPEADLDEAALTTAGAAVLRSSIAVEWGTFAQTRSELEALRETRRRHPDLTHLVVISGQDYPVRDLAEWERSVAGRGIDALLEPMPITPASIERRWYVLRGAPMPALARRVLAAVGYRLPAVTGDRVHVNPSPRDGDTRWWVGVPRAVRPGISKAALWKTLSARAVDVVLDRYETHPDERAYIERCRLPDELYTPTALTADGTLHVEQGTTSFTSWAPQASSPEWLGPQHLQAAADSGAPFARKLANDAPASLVAALDDLVTATA